MKCEKCGFEQEVGKFCGQCGAPIPKEETNKEQFSRREEVPGQNTGETVHTEHLATTDHTYSNQTQPSVGEQTNTDAMEKVKHTSKDYWAFFKEYLKHPSRIFTNREESFKNGLISMAIVAFMMAVSSAMLYGSFMDMAYYYNGPSGLSIFGYTLVFIAVSMVIILFILFLVNQLFGTAYSFKEMTSVYGAHLVPVIIVIAAAFLLILLKSFTIGGYLLLISFGLVVTTFPIYLISSLLTRQSKNLDPLYGYLTYLVLMGVAFLIFVVVLMDSTFGRMLNQFY
ncbi:Yip1 family protein [Virgibacillus sp. C22-A2]|uniref:Yip1 family protein n=1 Tax=Virgibacillus tibetensis TaxID=3042313 RepID=A0ABU6KDI8_9BACI|nr:Yip1 family protein [Virgibacillus sp. C22-A2]